MVSDDMRSWMLDCFDWFDERFDPPTSPVLPTKVFFQAPGGTGLETAKLVLEDVKRAMNFSGRVDLLPLDLIPAEYRHSYQSLSSVAGTYEVDRGIPVIRYDAELMNRPLQFINIMAHELMHARLAGLEKSVPGGEGAHELATDLGCIVAGFGAIQMQAADDAGWTGYMTQPSRAYALALFLTRRELGLDAVSAHLSSRCKKLLVRALKEV